MNKYILFLFFSLLPWQFIPIITPYDLYGALLLIPSILYLLSCPKHSSIFLLFLFVLVFALVIFLVHLPHVLSNCSDPRYFAILFRFLTSILVMPLIVHDLRKTKLSVRQSYRITSIAVATISLSFLCAPLLDTNIYTYGVTFLSTKGSSAASFLPLVTLFNPAFVLSYCKISSTRPLLCSLILIFFLLLSLLSGTRTSFILIASALMFLILSRVGSRYIIVYLLSSLPIAFSLKFLIDYLSSNNLFVGPLRSFVALLDISAMNYFDQSANPRLNAWSFASAPELIGNPADLCNYFFSTYSLSLDSTFLLFLLFGGYLALASLLITQFFAVFIYFRASNYSFLPLLAISVLLLSPHLTEIFVVSPGYLFLPFAVPFLLASPSIRRFSC